jgi:molybdopterin-binding protein
MRLSIRNQLTGVITEVNLGAVMATVQSGMPATVFVKSTEVAIGVD